MLLFGVQKQALNNVAAERVVFVLDSVSISAAELDMTGLIICSDLQWFGRAVARVFGAWSRVSIFRPKNLKTGNDLFCLSDFQQR